MTEDQKKALSHAHAVLEKAYRNVPILNKFGQEIAAALADIEVEFPYLVGKEYAANENAVQRP